MAFQQALSGLNTASRAIELTSNNIANSSTVGYKQASGHFADIYANNLNAAGNSQVGIGVNLTSVQQQFSQGNINSSNNPLDLSINGAGFFRINTNGAITYTRSGQFHLDKNGYIINDAGQQLTGYRATTDGTIVPSNPAALQVSAADIPPVATGTNAASTFQGVRANLNMDSRQAQPTNLWVDGGATGIWSPDPLTYNYSTALSVYDSLGNAHTLTMYFRKGDASGEWAVSANVDGTTNQRVTITGGSAVALNAGALTQQGLAFNTSGAIANTANASLNISIDLDGVMTDLGKPNNAATPLSFDLDFLGSTQFGTSFSNNRLEQDGFASGHLNGLSVDKNGIIIGRYSNGQTLSQGQVVLTNFTNVNGLESLGGNQWAETNASGPALVGAPNTSNLGVVQSSSVEESNVDLTAELVNLITEQRNYQANAQSIKTQDQIMQTLVNLR